MKLAKDENAKENLLFSNNTDEEITEVGVKDISFLLEMLSNHYSHPIRTLVQEYISNGRDACVEAGNTNPLDIKVPTHFDPVFSVRDYGIGMTQHRINTVFAFYGESTKRGGNGEKGGFGIGSKSCFAYTDMMTIITYLDGVQRFYTLYKEEDDFGRKAVKLSYDNTLDAETTETNGTEIQIAVDPDDIHKFQRAIWRATYFSQFNDNILGVDKDSVPEKIESIAKINKRMFTARRNDLPSFLDLEYSSERIVLLIDDIVYPLDNKILSDVPELGDALSVFNGRDNILFIRVGNGRVQVAETRESIKNTKYTRKFLKKLGKYTKHFLNKYLESALSKDNKTFEEYYTEYKLFSTKFILEDVKDVKTFGAWKIEKNGDYISHPLFENGNIKRHKYGSCTLLNNGHVSPDILFGKNNHLMFNDIPKEGPRRLKRRISQFNKNNRDLNLLSISIKDKEHLDWKKNEEVLWMTLNEFNSVKKRVKFKENECYRIQNENGKLIFKGKLIKNEDGVGIRSDLLFKVDHIVFEKIITEIKTDVKEFAALCKLFGGLKGDFSTLELEPLPERTYGRTGEVRADAEINYVDFRCGYYSNNIYLSENEKTYYYISTKYKDLDEKGWNSEDIEEVNNYLESRSLDLKIIGLSQSNLRKVKKHGGDKFIHADKIWDIIKPTGDEQWSVLKQLKSDNGYCIEGLTRINSLKFMQEDLTNKRFSGIVEEYEKLCNAKKLSIYFIDKWNLRNLHSPFISKFLKRDYKIANSLEVLDAFDLGVLKQYRPGKMRVGEIKKSSRPELEPEKGLRLHPNILAIFRSWFCHSLVLTLILSLLSSDIKITFREIQYNMVSIDSLVMLYCTFERFERLLHLPNNPDYITVFVKF